MKKGIFFRSFAVTALMFTACMLLFGLTMVLAGRSFIMQEKKDELHTQADYVRRYAEAVKWQGGLYNWELRINITTIARCSNDHIILCDSSGKVVTSSDEAFNSPYIGRQISDSVTALLSGGGEYEALSDLGGVYDEPCYVVGVPLLGRDSTTDGYVFVSYAGRGFFETWGGYIAVFVSVALAVLAAAVIINYLYARKLGKPLREMATAAQQMAGGDYSVRVASVGGDSEISDLTGAFNVMAAALERNESLRSDFIANISHELRTPLTTVSGFADGILDGTIPPDAERGYLETISSETKRLGRLVRSMLDMSRLRAGDPQARERRFDLTEAVVQTALSFEKRVEEKRLQMALDMPEDPVYAKGDIDAVTRVVYNLIDNAVKFSYAETNLTVSLWKENGKAWVSVKDVGQVIPEEELPMIFDRFHKTDRSRSVDRDGVGLGLYMVREIIAAHGEEIFVTSSEGGTAFTFSLTLAEAEDK